MASYTLSAMFDPQFVPAAQGALIFATQGNPNVVPAGVSYQIAVARIANVTQQPVKVKLWRVPAGEAPSNQYLIVPQIQIPPAATTFPWMDVSALWGVVLGAGDSIYALADTAEALVFHGDGVVITQ